MHRLIFRTPFVLAAVLTMLAVVAGPVAARTTTFTFHYESFGEIDESCGFPVQRDDIGDARVRFSDSRFDIQQSGVATLSNPDTGVFVTQQYQVLFKNRNTVDNGDGTFSFDNTAVGSATLSDANGRVLLRSHGPITTRITYIETDTGREWIATEVVFEHGAHNDCATLAAALYGVV
jgi:hypothetical protein